MTDDRDSQDRHEQEAETEALPTTRELPVTQPLPTAMQPGVDADDGAPETLPTAAAGAPPVVPPPSAGQPRDSQGRSDDSSDAGTDAAATGRSALPWALLISAVGVIALALIVSSLFTLANRPGGDEIAAGASSTPTASASAEPSPSDAATEDAEPDSQTTADQTVADDSGPPGDNGACSSEIVGFKTSDDTFTLEIRIDARAGGVDGWTADIDLDGAELTKADKVDVVSQAGDIYTVAGKGKTEQIDSGKSITFKIEAEGDYGDVAVGCHA